MIVRIHTGIATSMSAMNVRLCSIPAFAAESPSPPSVATDDGHLEEIVVTAQRRSQNQQDVPISITSVTGNLIAKSGVTNTESLSSVAPALQFSRQSGTGGTPFIRGVGTSSAQPGMESADATYVDDVYIGAPGSTTTLFNNIDHVEVLKGPQGTLFGRNATGGVVSIQTHKPSQTPAYEATFGYGRYNTTDLNLYVNQPLSSTFAVNVAAVRHKQADGYGIDISTNSDVYKDYTYGIRAEALWRPDDLTSVLLTGDYAHVDDDVGQNTVVLPGALSLARTTFCGKYCTSGAPNDAMRSKQYGGSLKIEHDFDIFRMVSITGYRHNNNYVLLDNDGSATPLLTTEVYNNRTKTFSQELHIMSPLHSRLQWIGGLIYYHANAGYDTAALYGLALAALGGRENLYGVQKTDAYAAFGEANYEIFHGTRLTVGARYTTDKFNFAADQTTASGTHLAGLPLTASDKFSKLTYRFILDRHLTKDMMVYASYSRGFKSGGYNVASPTLTQAGVTRVAPPVAPEIVDAYEIGAKLELFDKRLRINPSAFIYKYKNMQLNSFNNNLPQTLNAASANIKGIDLDFEAVPVEHLRLNGGIAILDSKFSSFPAAPYYIPSPAVCTPVPTTTGPLTGGNTTCNVNLTGNRPSRSPKFTATFGVTYGVPTDIGLFELSGSFYHNSGFFWEVDNRIRQPAYNLLGSVLVWTSNDKHFQASLWARNLTNAYYYTFASEGTFKDSGSPAMPRSYGMTIGVRY
jgi:iron complex outermembrane recepter protein